MNRTHYTPVRSAPIVVNFETKLVGTEYESAQTQIAVWAFAQFKHLRRTCGKAPQFLPLLVVQGDDWSFLAATQSSKADGSAASAGESGSYTTTIWEKVFIGSITSLEGVWKVSAVLQYLAAWSATEYLRWLHTCLDLQEVWSLKDAELAEPLLGVENM